MKKFKRAFTIVELVIVIAVVAILAAVLIPTISSVVDNANLSSDEQVAVNLTKQIKISLATNEINDESDIWNILEETYGENYAEALVAKSKGNNFWYDIENKEVFVGNAETLVERENESNNTRVSFSRTTNSGFDLNSLRLFKDRFLLLDKSNNGIGEIFNKLETMVDGAAYADAIVKLQNDTNAIFTELFNKLQSYVIITNVGSFRFNSVDVNKVYFASGLTTITSNLYIYNNGSCGSAIQSSKQNPIVYGVNSVVLPNTVTTVNAGGLYFEEDEVVEVHGNFKEMLDVTSVFKDNSTNGVIICGENKYLVDDNKLTNIDGEKVGDLGYSVIVDNINFSVESNDAYKLIGNTLYVGYYYTDEIQLTVKAFSESNAVEATVQQGELSYNGTKCLTLSSDKVLQLTGIPKNGLDTQYSVSYTIFGYTETLEIVIVIPTTASIKIDNKKVDIDNIDEEEAITLSYIGNNKFIFDSLNMETYTSTEINLGNREFKYELECNSDKFTCESDGIMLSDNIGEYNCNLGVVQLKVKDKDNKIIFTKNINITLEDKSDLPIKLVFENTDSYLYRVGNANAIKLSSLFSCDKAGDDVTLNIYDGIKATGGTKVPIATKDASFTATVSGTLSESTWKDATIKFGGEGIALIEIGNSKGTQQVLVEVINAKNITDASELSSSTNNVLLNDISIASGGTFILNENKGLYGNGFTFDITNGSTSSDPSHHGVITLNSATLDNTKVIGKVYTEFVDKANTNYFMAAVSVKGNSIISNSYISNCQVAVRVNGESLLLDNTILYGGRFGNMQIRAGVVTLKNVTTINGSFIKDDVQNAIGAGILIYEEAADTSKIIVEGDLIQYNWINKDDTQYLPSVASPFFSKPFSESSYKIYRSTYDNVIYANLGIVNFNKNISSVNMEMPTYYSTLPVSISGGSGWIYSQNMENKQSPFDSTGINQYPTWQASAQGIYKPVFSWSYPSEYVSGTIAISFKYDETYSFNPNFLSVTKYNENYKVFVSIDGVDYTDKEITLDQSQESTITYTVNDKYNYDVSGKASTITYTFTIDMYVIEQEPEAKEAEFKYNGNDMKKVQIGDDVYVMPNVTNTSDTIKSTTVNGTTVYVPIVTVPYETSGSTNWYYTPLFNAITITDYQGATQIAVYDVEYNGDYPLQGKSGVTSDNVKELAYFGENTEDNKIKGFVTHKSYGLCYKNNSSAEKNQGARENTVEFFFIDGNGNRYIYIICYSFPKLDASYSGGGCVADGTLITLSDGTQIPVENIKGDETLLVWNYVTGNYDSSKIAYVVNHNNLREEQQVLNLKFSDGSNIEMIGEHGFYSVDLNKWVYLTINNVDQYLGNKFVSSYTNDESLWNEITLVDYEIYSKETGVYEIVTYGNLACYTNGILSVSGYTGGLLDIFDVNTDTMTYDLEKMQQEIEEYGLYTYEDFKDLVPEQVFEMYNAKYLKVAIGKGLMTWDDVLALIEVYENNEIVPIG